ncbi:phosphoglucomutase/phosphomannomutase [Listeria monocytogenes FSL J1-208]|uniref:phospho-sugar mutase n=1 Tax=Listeria monocytogenes TaxID=1639 RepID=UPI0002548BF8|nr:phospho-sugar mutase [Listeria monocytogenes]EAE5920998.1 phospho-sugar mutase [Listeria monocytogenes]EAG6686631.1 phospho-sugar mutase [Listeria monocytogenes]EHY63147.1 phosphoglucomutase/phosphomannomutase [Listeria monocytogenes FSL J1-208]OEO46585.1 phosphomannomutase [Listeria monocytogenes]QOF63133.1 phospho-sugar mutase [Listeria monocytogenes FSL J1-208]
MTWQQHLNAWQNADLSDEWRRELEQVEQEQERFDGYLTFGTGGMRGKMGVGTKRINIFTIRRVAKGLGDYVVANGGAEMGVAIAYDSRHYSKAFAMETAKVLAAQGINVYLSDTIRPTPALSFCVREKGAFAGVVITASHNPSIYNGFKVYDENGCQITLGVAQEIAGYLEKITNIFTIPVRELPNSLVTPLGKEMDDAYLNALTAVISRPNLLADYGNELRICYTPLHGAGKELVMRGLLENGFSETTMVAEQSEPDGEFPTVISPNPEEENSFELAKKQAKEIQADIILATDPDADRLGVAVLTKQATYQILTGNQLGALLLQYILEAKTSVTQADTMINTIVTGDLGGRIAQDFGINHIQTLTGFKYIGEKIAEMEDTEKNFLFGYEESYGYLIAPFVRDKDAVQAALLTAEMALFYKKEGTTLFQKLTNLYEKFGYHKEHLHTITLDDSDGTTKMNQVIDALRKEPTFIPGITVLEDFLTSKRTKLSTMEMTNIELPKENVLKFYLNDNAWFAIRPSGTEPKCKIYFQTICETEEIATKAMDELKTRVLAKWD